MHIYNITLLKAWLIPNSSSLFQNILTAFQMFLLICARLSFVLIIKTQQAMFNYIWFAHIFVTECKFK